MFDLYSCCANIAMEYHGNPNNKVYSILIQVLNNFYCCYDPREMPAIVSFDCSLLEFVRVKRNMNIEGFFGTLLLVFSIFVVSTSAAGCNATNCIHGTCLGE